jgi:hypothetical protein
VAKFQKGQSGNPGGRPKLPENAMSRAEALAFIASCVPEALERMRQHMQSADEKVSMRACELILERHLGKVSEAQPVATDEGKVDTVDFIPAVVTHTAAE